MFNKYCPVTLLCFFCFTPLFSKEHLPCLSEYSFEVIDTVRSPDNYLFNNYAAWGLQYAVSDITPQSSGVMFSMLYGYHISPNISCEASLHFLRYLQIENSYSSITLPNNTVLYQPEHSSSVSQMLAFDITGFLYPFGVEQKNISVGAGFSGRWGASMRNFARVKSSGLEEYFSFFTNQFALGANIKVDYIVPLSAILDVGFRLSGQFFFPPVQVTGDNIALGYFLTPDVLPPFYGATVSLGAFLRINF